MIKILIVDDSNMIRKQLRNLLSTIGYEIVEGKDGKEGLAAAIAESPDLVITDLNMPHMNGLELITSLRQKEEFKLTPVIMLTTETTADLKAQGQQLGVRAWAVKPINEDNLMKILGKILKKRPEVAGVPSG